MDRPESCLKAYMNIKKDHDGGHEHTGDHHVFNHSLSASGSQGLLLLYHGCRQLSN